MKLVLNNHKTYFNHKAIISEEIKKSNFILIFVSFIKASGLSEIISQLNGQDVKVICTSELNITEGEALLKLLENENTDCRLYNPANGVFHSKVWYFENDAYTSCLIGSANLTYSALQDNFETSILIESSDTNALKEKFKSIFEETWQKCLKINKDLINGLIESQKQREKLLSSIKEEVEVSSKKIEAYGKNGWYLINNQWKMTDELLSYLQKVCLEIDKQERIDCKTDEVFFQYEDLKNLMAKNPHRRQRERAN